MPILLLDCQMSRDQAVEDPSMLYSYIENFNIHLWKQLLLRYKLIKQ
jgi:hypothetical protein